MLDGQAKYDSYKDSGVPWIGVVPSDWDVLPGRACLYENKDKNTGMKEETVLSLSYGRVKIKPVEDQFGLMPESYETYQIVRPGDVIIRGTDLQNDVTSLRTGLAKDHGIITSAYINLRPRPNILPIFLHYLLSSYDDMKVFYGLGSGLRQNLSYADFKYIGITVPDLDTQNRIIKFLDEKTAEIDTAVGKKRRLIDLLNEQKAILINRAVTKGLNPDAPMKNSGVDWIGETPTHWRIVPLMSIAEVIDPNPSHRNPEYVAEGFPFISTQEFKGWDEIEIDTPRRVSEKTVMEQERRCRFRRGSIVFSRKGTIGATRVLPHGVRLGILDSLCVINPKNGVTPEYLVGTLGADYLAAQYGPTVKGAALPQLSVGRVRGLKIILPPDDEQQSVQNKLASIRKDHHRLDEIVHKEIATLNEFKQTLIANAVTGKIKI
jgi:type I restriction enzyme S subunit